MKDTVQLNNNLVEINEKVFLQKSLTLSEFQNEKEGKEYDACRFKLNGENIICRSSKVTPKKVGQFVTFWKRNKEGETTPFDENDPIDFYFVICKDEKNFGQFVFPIFELIKRGIVSTKTKTGKRGFRVYPKWCEVTSKQAIKTQEWQLNFFAEIDDSIEREEIYEKYF